MRRRELIASLPALGALEVRAQAVPRKTLHVAFPAPETALDPAQNNTDLYSSTILAQILEAPLTFDYLARPARLVTATAASLPEVSADGRRFTIRLQPDIYFGDHAAFKGRRRELVAADYVYSIKRFYDPKYNSSDLYLYESVKLPGLSELRQRAAKNRTPFDYDTEAEGLRTLDRYTFVLVLGEADPRF